MRTSEPAAPIGGLLRAAVGPRRWSAEPHHVDEPRVGTRLTRSFVAITSAVIGLAAVALTGCNGEEARQSQAEQVRRGLTVGKPVTASPRARPELAMSRSTVGNPPRRDVIALDSSGMNVRLLASGGAPTFVSRLSWSPDGTRLAFAQSGDSVRDDGIDIFVVNAEGGVRRLTKTDRSFAPVWSPDGRTIVFAQYAAGTPYPSTTSLWSMSSDGSNRRELIEAEPGRTDVPSSFSPDGTELAVTRCESRLPDEQARIANACAIHILDVRTLELRKLIERAADAAFSPGGEQIAYVTDTDENGDLS